MASFMYGLMMPQSTQMNLLREGGQRTTRPHQTPTLPTPAVYSYTLALLSWLVQNIVSWLLRDVWQPVFSFLFRIISYWAYLGGRRCNTQPATRHTNCNIYSIPCEGSMDQTRFCSFRGLETFARWHLWLQEVLDMSRSGRYRLYQYKVLYCCSYRSL